MREDGPATSDGATSFRPDEAYARELDRTDELAEFRTRFHIPRADGDTPSAYFCGHSLGLQPVDARSRVESELEAWARLAVDAHFEAEIPWYSYHEQFREPLARIVGARPAEVVAMNGLTNNLHLMMVSFYRPDRQRHAIVIEGGAFPSDTYAARSQIRFHGHDPERSLWTLAPNEGETTIRIESIEELLERRGHEIALVLLGGVNYFTGQYFDIERIARAARKQGCVIGCDLAHAAGNLPLRLHDWDVDFAVWCNYKYLNGGPGTVGGCFVHERHAQRPELPRFSGWWGNDPNTRFRMHLENEFHPVSGADGWQLSNPPILAMAPLRASLDLFDRAGIVALRSKSERLTGYLERWIDHAGGNRVRILTPGNRAARGSQLSLTVGDGARGLFERMRANGVTIDFRKPDVLRVAPVPMYNSFHDVWRFGQVLENWANGRE